ncbi:hypothetical protein [Mycobacterium talmoniae]|nr:MULTISPECIES: hypothetical protein [Mycobacterium]PQM44315.1 hypothetical protein C1Y40_05527 [Mycobacterium talmoniae]TDH50771.1 hypothetical protein E2F47_17300 [Mycobacterium eburneum]
MNAEELAARLSGAIAPRDAIMRRLIDVGEPVAAIIDLMEKAATERVAVPPELLAEVEQMIGDGDFDEVDARSVSEDVAVLRTRAVSTS